jgi:hypothetical protein
MPPPLSSEPQRLACGSFVTDLAIDGEVSPGSKPGMGAIFQAVGEFRAGFRACSCHPNWYVLQYILALPLPSADRRARREAGSRFRDCGITWNDKTPRRK